MAKSLAKSWQGGSGHGSGGRGGGETGGGGGGGGEGGGGRGEGGGGGGSGGQLARMRRTALIKSNNPHLAGGELLSLFCHIMHDVLVCGAKTILGPFCSRQKPVRSRQ